MLTDSLLASARDLAPEVVALRRAIHAEPELGLETPRTLAKVKDALADLPLEWREGPSCTGAVAVLKGGKSGPAVLLRGDMDALPMDEHTGLDFASTVPGRDRNLSDQLGEDLSALRVGRRLLPLDGRPLAMSRHRNRLLCATRCTPSTAFFRPGARFSALFTEQTNTLDHHSTIEGFCHVVHGEEPY